MRAFAADNPPGWLAVDESVSKWLGWLVSACGSSQLLEGWDSKVDDDLSELEAFAGKAQAEDRAARSKEWSNWA